MARCTCPRWLGFFLVSPLRRLTQNPRAIVGRWVSEGMTVLEPGPGMGFFTLDLARLVGPTGRVVAVDVQLNMLESLIARARRAGLNDRIDERDTAGDDLGVGDLAGSVDFILAFAVVHEMWHPDAFFAQALRALKPGGRMLVAEPKLHVTKTAMARTVALAEAAGFSIEERPAIWSSRAVLFCRPPLRRTEAASPPGRPPSNGASRGGPVASA